MFYSCGDFYCKVSCWNSFLRRFCLSNWASDILIPVRKCPADGRTFWLKRISSLQSSTLLAEWVTSRNQDRREKHQQPQICGKWRGTKEPLDEHEGEWKSRPQTKLKKKKKKIMASSTITAWQIEGEKVEVVMDFLFLGSKVTADGDCSYKIKRLFFYDKPRQCIKKQRHHLANKSLCSQSYSFLQWSCMAVRLEP